MAAAMLLISRWAGVLANHKHCARNQRGRIGKKSADSAATTLFPRLVVNPKRSAKHRYSVGLGLLEVFALIVARAWPSKS